MKTLIITTLVFLLAIPALAQSPDQMSYQAVVRDASSQLVTNSTIGVSISILQGSAAGTVVFSEIHTPTSNANGLVSFEIGRGLPATGMLAEIDWANGPYFLKTEIDPAGGVNYTISGTSQFITVPYAMYSTMSDSANHATTADNATSASHSLTAGHAETADTSRHANTATLAANSLRSNNALSADVADSANVAALAWEVRSRKRSVTITPGMINDAFFTGGTAHYTLLTNNFQSTVNVPEGGIAEFKINFAVPSDYGGNGITARVLYTTSTTTGNMDCHLFARGTDLGNSVNPNVGGGGLLLSPSAAVFDLNEATVRLAFVGANTRMINLRFRRNSTSATDTSTGDLRVLGIVLEYND